MSSSIIDENVHKLYQSSSIYESCLSANLRRNESSQSSLSDSDCSNFSYEEEYAPHLRRIIVKKLGKRIRELSERIGLEIRFNSDTNPLTGAVDDILKLSENEPYGIKGACVLIKIKSLKHDEFNLGTVPMDHSTICTFKIVLTLKETSKMSLSIKNWIGFVVKGEKPVHLIGSQYEVKKMKLYRICQTSESCEDSFAP